MEHYCQRWLHPLLARKIKDHPAVIVTGARQVGKTTLLKEEFPQWSYLTLDDYSLFAQLKKDPEFILSSKQPLILDEIQRLPELFIPIKKMIDQNPHFRCILSGSANLLLMNHVSESLAGRAVFLELGPLTQGEILSHSPTSLLKKLLEGKVSFHSSFPTCEDIAFRVWHGGMPQIYRRKKREAILEWFEGYVKTYLERDLKQLSQIDNLSDFRHVMIASALRTGQLLNISEMARDLGIKQPTAHRYLNLLEVSGLVFRLPAYSMNRGKRLMKSPKIMWIDSGLAAYLSGHYSPEDLEKSREWGGILESFIFHQLKQLANLMVPSPHIHHWRTTGGDEVDFVVEHGQSLVAIEVKSASRVTYADIGHLQKFLQDYPNAKVGVLLHRGKQVEQLAKNIFSLPFSILWDK